jgi:predicted metal-binding membrane protein
MLSTHPPREHHWTVPAADLPAAVPLAIALAWATALAAQATGHSSLLHGHNHAQEHGLPLWLIVLLPPFWVTVAGFLLAWLVMVTAMMLPASLHVIRRVAAAAAGHPRPHVATGAFLAGHAYTWGAFGVLAYLADIATHPHSTLVVAAVLTTAGTFQFAALKRTCLAHRRNFDPNLLQEPGGRVAAAFWLGRNHGLACVGCCGPLMLLMLTVRAAPLLLMAALTALMLCETVPRVARTATPMIGVALLLAAALLLAHPTWVPQALSWSMSRSS